MEYGVVIPVKNEARGIGNTLQSLLNQSVPPAIIVVMDDGSVDDTVQVVNTYINNYPHIHVVSTQLAVSYELGGKIVQIFNMGVDYIKKSMGDVDFYVKMDADVVFDSTIFKTLLSRAIHHRLGIISATPYVLDEKNRKVSIVSPLWHTNGDFKIYQADCLNDISPLPLDYGWDCADNIRAMDNGWKTVAFRDIAYEQKRPIGRYSLKKGWYRQGIGAYKLGYGVGYIFLKALHDLFKKPVVMGSYFYVRGFFEAGLKHETKVLTVSQQKLLRKLRWEGISQRFRNRELFIFHMFRWHKNSTS